MNTSNKGFGLVCCLLMTFGMIGGCQQNPREATWAPEIPLKDELLKVFSAIQEGKADLLLSYLSPDEKENYGLNLKRMEDVLLLYKKETKGLVAGVPVIDGSQSCSDLDVILHDGTSDTAELSLVYYGSMAKYPESKGAHVMTGITIACAMGHIREPNLKIIDNKRFDRTLIAGLLAVEPEFKAIGVSQVCTGPRRPCLSFEQFAERMKRPGD